MSSAIKTPAFQAKANNIQNQADTSAVYSDGEWSFKNSSAVASVTISDAGNVGIGTASPNGALGIARAAATSAFVEIAGNGNTPGVSSVFLGQDGASTGYVWNRANTALTFGTSNTERMRIDANGNVGIGVVPPGVDVRLSSKAADGNMHAADFQNNQANLYSTIVVRNNATTGTRKLIDFRQNATTIGFISHNGSTVTYATTTSDYRLKEQVQNLSDGLEKIKQLRPVSFKWKESGKEDFGFIAHELQAIVPECVTGEKDAVDEEGNPSYQSIFPAPAQMIASLVAAIQELSAKNEALEARLAALESK